MEVRQLIRRTAVTVLGTSTIGEVARKMRDSGIGSLVVILNDSPRGIVSERDIVTAFADGESPEASLVDVISLAPLTARPDSTVEEVARIMQTNNVRHIPLVAEGGELVGLVSVKDVLEELLKHGSAAVAEPDAG